MLAPPLKKRVDAAILKLNYRPNSLAQSLANERTRTLGVIVPDISNPFFPMLVRGAEDTAQKRGYSILLCNSDGLLEKEELYLDLLVAKRVDGILLTKSPGEPEPANHESAFQHECSHRADDAHLPRTDGRRGDYRRSSGQL